jgi:hypothetical protein
MGNGDDADCLDGLGCGSGECKRKIGTDCTDAAQCLSGVCHKSKCTAATPGTCTANMCGEPTMDSQCLPTTLATNDCGFNYLPNASCILDFKGTSGCVAVCQCNLEPCNAELEVCHVP